MLAPGGKSFASTYIVWGNHSYFRFFVKLRYPTMILSSRLLKLPLTHNNVRVAEWSKAPDSRAILPLTEENEHSGPRMRAWVQIPPLTRIFFIKKKGILVCSEVAKDKKKRFGNST